MTKRKYIAIDNGSATVKTTCIEDNKIFGYCRIYDSIFIFQAELSDKESQLYVDEKYISKLLVTFVEELGKPFKRMKLVAEFNDNNWILQAVAVNAQEACLRIINWLEQMKKEDFSDVEKS